MAFDDKLKMMNDLYKSGKDKLPGVPDGQYTCQLQAAYLDVSKSSGNLMVKREHLVIEGEHSGETIYDQIVLHSEQSAYWLNKWIVAMGFEGGLDNLDELPGILKEMSRRMPIYSAVVKLSGEFRNVRVKELISGSSNDKAEDGDEPKAQGDGMPEDGGGDFPESGPQLGDVINYINEGVQSKGKVINYDKASKAYHVADLDNPDSVWAVTVEAIVSADAEVDEREELTVKALDLCLSHDLGGVIGDSLEDLTKRLKGKEWVRDELLDDEIKDLEVLGIPVKDKPKAPPNPVKPAPKPVSPKPPEKPVNKPQGKPQGSKPVNKPTKGKK